MSFLKNLVLFDKINVGKVITNHVNTLVNDNTEKAELSDWITFAFLPAAFACIMLFAEINLGNDAITIIITALSIFVGLLFNVLVLVFDILNRDPSKKTKNKLLRQLLANITFTILLSIIIIALCLLHLIPIPNVVKVVNYTIYFSLAFFFLTLLMVLKRMFMLFENEMKEIERAAPKESTGNDPENAEAGNK